MVNQIEWSPFGWSADMLSCCRERGIVIQAYSSLIRAQWLGDEKLAAVAAAYDRTPAQVLLDWNLQLGVASLPKANREEHLKENLGAFDFERSEGPLTALQDFNEHYSSLGSLQYV